MKKLFVVITASCFSLALYALPGGVNEKVLKVFNESYSDAKNVKWSEAGNNYSVSFSLSGIISRLVYDQDGNVLSSLRYYGPEFLPVNIHNALQKRFSGKKLYGVTEAGNSDNVVYFVKICDDKNWYTVRVDSSGNSEVTEKLKRADIEPM